MQQCIRPIRGHKVCGGGRATPGIVQAIRGDTSECVRRGCPEGDLTGPRKLPGSPSRSKLESQQVFGFSHVSIVSCDRTTFVQSIYVYFSPPPSSYNLYRERQSILVLSIFINPIGASETSAGSG